MNALFIPFLLQGAFMMIDEFFFHFRRGLPAWEAWGHPLDTLSVLLPFSILAFAPPAPHFLYLYGALAIFSCLFVTKDEFVHAKLCDPGEHWLHAMLFLLHSLSFFAGAILWMQNEAPWFLRAQLYLLSGFMIYQIVYWIVYGGNAKILRRQ